MHFINLMVNYLDRKYGVSINNFSENLIRGSSHLNALASSRWKMFHYKFIIRIPETKHVRQTAWCQTSARYKSCLKVNIHI